MGTISGRNVKVEVALTLGSPVSPTAVTKAYPPVATLTAHGLAAGTVGFWTVTAGMVELNEQAVYLYNPLTNTFDLPGLDSTDYSTYTTGTLTNGATWGTISEAASYNVGGGAAAQLDDTRLFDIKVRNVAGNLPSQDVTFDIKQGEISGTAMAFVERQASRGLKVLMKITKAGQILRVLYDDVITPDDTVILSKGHGCLAQYVVLEDMKWEKERECKTRFIVASCIDAAKLERRQELDRLRSRQIRAGRDHALGGRFQRGQREIKTSRI